MTAHLATLIRLRQYDVDRNQLQLSANQREESELLEKLRTLDDHIAQQRLELESLTSARPFNINSLRLRQEYLQQLNQQRGELQLRVAEIQLKSHASRDQLIAADQRLQVVEKLREKVLIAQRQAELKHESLQAEEAWQANRVA